MSAGAVAAIGAVVGAVAGAVVGWLLGQFDLVGSLTIGPWLAIDGAATGAILGGVVGLIGYSVTAPRAAATPACFRAEAYEVAVDAELAERAVAALRGTPAGRTRGPD